MHKTTQPVYFDRAEKPWGRWRCFVFILESFQSLSHAQGLAISLSVRLQAEQSRALSGRCELFRSHMFLGFSGWGVLALNPWPAQRTKEWQGAQLNMMEVKNGKRDSIMKSSFIFAVWWSPVEWLEVEVWNIHFDLDHRQLGMLKTILRHFYIIDQTIYLQMIKKLLNAALLYLFTILNTQKCSICLCKHLLFTQKHMCSHYLFPGLQ